MDSANNPRRPASDDAEIEFTSPVLEEQDDGIAFESDGSPPRQPPVMPPPQQVHAGGTVVNVNVHGPAPAPVYHPQPRPIYQPQPRPQTPPPPAKGTPVSSFLSRLGWASLIWLGLALLVGGAAYLFGFLSVGMLIAEWGTYLSVAFAGLIMLVGFFSLFEFGREPEEGQIAPSIVVGLRAVLFVGILIAGQWLLWQGENQLVVAEVRSQVVGTWERIAAGREAPVDLDVANWDNGGDNQLEFTRQGTLLWRTSNQYAGGERRFDEQTLDFQPSGPGQARIEYSDYRIELLGDDELLLIAESRYGDDEIAGRYIRVDSKLDSLGSISSGSDFAAALPKLKFALRRLKSGSDKLETLREELVGDKAELIRKLKEEFGKPPLPPEAKPLARELLGVQKDLKAVLAKQQESQTKIAQIESMLRTAARRIRLEDAELTATDLAEVGAAQELIVGLQEDLDLDEPDAVEAFEDEAMLQELLSE